MPKNGRCSHADCKNVARRGIVPQRDLRNRSRRRAPDNFPSLSKIVLTSVATTVTLWSHGFERLIARRRLTRWKHVVYASEMLTDIAKRYDVTIRANSVFSMHSEF